MEAPPIQCGEYSASKIAPLQNVVWIARYVSQLCTGVISDFSKLHVG